MYSEDMSLKSKIIISIIVLGLIVFGIICGMKSCGVFEKDIDFEYAGGMILEVNIIAEEAEMNIEAIQEESTEVATYGSEQVSETEATKPPENETPTQAPYNYNYSYNYNYNYNYQQ